MGSIKWLIMLVFVLNWKEEEAVCKQELTQQPEDLFACNYSLLRPDSSVELDEVLTVGANRKKCSLKHAPCHVTLCSSPSPPRPFLEIRFKYFYDVCAVTTWTNISNLTDIDFNIQFSHKGHLWYYYREMGQIKNFQRERNNSNIFVHHLHLTTKYIRFRPVKWKMGSCLHFAMHGNIASCRSSQRRMDRWCRSKQGQVNLSRANCAGELRARFDRSRTSKVKLWRCYYESALKSDLSGYDDTLKSRCYETRHLQLKLLSKSCTNTPKIKGCDLLANNWARTGQQETNKSEQTMNISEYIENFSQLKKTYKAQARMSSSDILDVVGLLENVLPDDLLRNATQQKRDLFAQSFLEMSNTVFNETNIPTWTNSLLNSTASSRLLKAVEDFGVAFTKYLECDNKTENGRLYSFSNIIFLARSCVSRSSFPMKLFSSQGCNAGNDSFDACNSSSELTNNAIIPASSMDDHQQWQVSFVSYKNAHRVFPVQSTKGDAHLGPVKVDSCVMSLSVKPDELVSKENPVVMTVKPFSHNSKNEKDFYCGFWNFSIPGTLNGAWSTDGCSVLSINRSQVTCQCSHLTNFALLLRMTPDSNTRGIHKDVLKWMTYLGLSLSLAAEILCLLAFIVLTKVKETKVKIHINLVACLAVGHLVFLTGVENAAGHKVICTIVAVTLHFFFLASFMWMLVEGIHLLSKVKTVFQSSNKLGIAYGFAYGLPLVIVGGTFAVKFNEYGTLNHCWLSLSSGTIWSFIAPVCCILLVNIIVLVFVLYRLTNTKVFSNKSHWKKIRITVRASLIMIPLLGLSWFFGLATVNEDTIAFQYVFVGLNSLQGVFIFLFQCVVHDEIKNSFRGILRRRRVTQQVTRIVSKARSKENTPEDRRQRLWPKEALSLPGITVVDHHHIKVVQTVQMTRITQRNQKNSTANHAYQSDEASVTSVKVAWRKTTSV